MRVRPFDHTKDPGYPKAEDFTELPARQKALPPAYRRPSGAICPGSCGGGGTGYHAGLPDYGIRTPPPDAAITTEDTRDPQLIAWETIIRETGWKYGLYFVPPKVVHFRLSRQCQPHRRYLCGLCPERHGAPFLSASRERGTLCVCPEHRGPDGRQAASGMVRFSGLGAGSACRQRHMTLFRSTTDRVAQHDITQGETEP